MGKEGNSNFNKDPKKEHVGRKKGTPNKSTQYNRNFVQSLLDEEAEDIQTALAILKVKDPDAYLKHIKEFMKFVMPQMSAVKVEDDTKERKVSISLDLHDAYEDMIGK